MGFRFRRSIRILPFLRLNVGKRGVSTSLGVRGAHVTIGHGQVRETVGIPGTGLSHTEVHKAHADQTRAEAPGQATAAGAPTRSAWRGWLIVALALALSLILMVRASRADAREPWAVMGMGTMKCVAYINASKNQYGKPVSAGVLAWVQGWFSARNLAGTQGQSPRTVGGSLSAATLEGFLISDCEERPQEEIWLVADSLYDRLASKGL